MQLKRSRSHRLPSAAGRLPMALTRRGADVESRIASAVTRKSSELFAALVLSLLHLVNLNRLLSRTPPSAPRPASRGFPESRGISNSIRKRLRSWKRPTFIRHVIHCSTASFLFRSYRHITANMSATRVQMALNLARPRQTLARGLRPTCSAFALQRRTKATAPFRLPDPRNEPNVSQSLLATTDHCSQS